MTAAQRIQSRYQRNLGYQPQSVFSRPYSATAALSFPRRTSRESASESTTTDRAAETQQETLEDATVDQHNAVALEASANDLDQAKHNGAILELESIDSLVANIDETSTKSLTPRNAHAKSVAYPEFKSNPKRPAEPSRLKRLKIVKEPPKTETEERLPPKKKEGWQIQKASLQQKFPEGWSPRKRLSPDALEGIRALHSQFPEDYTTEVLAEKFEVSPEAIRRILRSKWTPSTQEEEERQTRWFNRGKNIWSQMAALGKKPPQRWRREGIVRDPYWNRPRGPRTQPPRQRRYARRLEE